MFGVDVAYSGRSNEEGRAARPRFDSEAHLHSIRFNPLGGRIAAAMGFEILSGAFSIAIVVVAIFFLPDRLVGGVGHLGCILAYTALRSVMRSGCPYALQRLICWLCASAEPGAVVTMDILLPWV